MPMTTDTPEILTWYGQANSSTSLDSSGRFDVTADRPTVVTYHLPMALSIGLPSVERLLGLRLRDLDFDGLRRIVDLRLAEDANLDFKRDFSTRGERSVELAKDICSLANAQGGLLVFGIVEDNGVANSLAPFPCPSGELRDRVAQVLRSHTRPTPAFDVTSINDLTSEFVFVVVGVPRSRDAPHAVIRTDKQDPWFQFPVRYESTTRFMDESELAARYSQRQASASERLTKVRTLISSTDERPSQITLALSLVPINSGQFTLDSRAADRCLASITKRLEEAAGSMGIRLDVKPIRYSFKPSRIRVHFDSGELDLHSDGSVHATLHRDPFVAASLGRVVSRPAGFPDEVLVATISGLLDLAGRFTREECGCAGEALAAIRIRATRPDQGTRSIGLVAAASAHTREQRRMIGTTCDEVSTETSVVVEDLTTTSTRLLETTFRLASLVTQHFSLPNPVMLTDNGQLKLDGFSHEARPHVKAWSEQYEVHYFD